VNLLKAVSTVSGLTLLSRITGLMRESLKAVAFGAGLQMDAFEAAFRLPNILRRLFAEGAFSQAFVPILAEYKRARGDAATRDLVGRVGTLLAVLLIALSVVGIFAAPWLVYALAGGFARTPGKVELTAELIRIMFPYILFISLVSLAGGVLNIHRNFAIPAITPVLLNVAIIAAAIFVAPHTDPPIVALAWGVAFGGVAQLALQIRPLWKLGMLPRFRFDWRDEGVRRVLSAMGPAVLGVSAAQISALINTQFAAYLGDGRISWITYADRLMEFPSALLGVALGTVLLPSLAKHHHDANDAQYRELLDWGLRLTFLLALPAALALAVLATPLIATLYQYGRFTVNDVWQTRAALLGYSVGLLGLIAVKILAPGFYARQNMKTPVKIAFLTVLVTQLLALVLMFQIGHAGLTLATLVGLCFNGTLFYWAIPRQQVFSRLP
jgi:putative peptidoglycan lipid II flippase